jgi:hypothetical protein
MNSHSRLGNDGTKSKRTAQGFESSSVCALHSNTSVEDSSRRRFLQMTVGGTVVGLATAAGVGTATGSGADDAQSRWRASGVDGWQ